MEGQGKAVKERWKVKARKGGEKAAEGQGQAVSHHGRGLVEGLERRDGEQADLAVVGWAGRPRIARQVVGGDGQPLALQQLQLLRLQRV